MRNLKSYFRKYLGKKKVDYFDADAFFLESEWVSFNHTEKLEKQYSETLLANIKHEIDLRRKNVLWHAIYKIAAVVAGITIISVLYHYNTKITKHVAAQNKFIIHQYSVRNTGAAVKIVRMVDGSVVSLSPNSVINYTNEYNKDKREISIEGKATFKVFKDKSRPFIVKSEKLFAIALGTEFTVTSFAEITTISIFLKEGKLLIRPHNHLNDQKRFYMLAGDEFRFDKDHNVASLIKAKKRRNSIKTSDAIYASEIGNWYMFEDQSLSSVFDQLGLIYDVQIRYNSHSIRNINFIGRIESADNLLTILDDITRMNNLTVSRLNDHTFIIK